MAPVRLRIATRLFILIGLATFALLLVIGASVTGTRSMAGAGQALHDRGVFGVEHASHLYLLFERQRGLVGRTPAETDLGRQQNLHAQFDALSADETVSLGQLRTLTGGGDRDRIDLIGALFAQLHHDAGTVFENAANFLQDKATDALDGPFAATEKQLEAALTDLLDTMLKGADTDVARLVSARDVTIAGVAGVSLVGVLLVDGFGMLLARALSRRLRRMTDAMTALANGNLEVATTGEADRDEIGEMARALLVFKQNKIAADRLATATEGERAARDRRQEAMDRHTRDFGTSVGGVMASLIQSADGMRRAATDMSEAARKTHASTSVTVTGANSSSRELSAVAAAAEHMAESITEISRQVTHVTMAVREAVVQASTTDGKVTGLVAAADRIGDVVRMIRDIAEQTNLLALNATIEAARAGDAGKGFAVVAGEVKALAGQTARSTEQINTQIIAIRAATEEAASAVKDAGSAIGRVEAVATAIAAAVEEQAAATREITANVRNATVTIAASAEALGEVLAIADGAALSSQSVLAEAGEVGQTAETLRAEVSDFLAAMAHVDEQTRRRYERIQGNGAVATVRFADGADITGTILNISRGGMALSCARAAAVSTAVEVALPGANGPVPARVTRAEDQVLSLAFHQDGTSLARIDRALDEIAGMQEPIVA